MSEYTNWMALYRQKRYNEILWRWIAVLRFWVMFYILWDTYERRINLHAA